MLWLQFLNGSVKKHPFYPVKISSVFSKPFFLVHVASNVNDSADPAPFFREVTSRMQTPAAKLANQHIIRKGDLQRSITTLILTSSVD